MCIGLKEWWSTPQCYSRSKGTMTMRRFDAHGLARLLITWLMSCPFLSFPFPSQPEANPNTNREIRGHRRVRSTDMRNSETWFKKWLKMMGSSRSFRHLLEVGGGRWCMYVCMYVHVYVCMLHANSVWTRYCICNHNAFEYSSFCLYTVMYVLYLSMYVCI